MRRLKPLLGIALAAGTLCLAPAFGEDLVSLQYTYRPDKGGAARLTGQGGIAYLSLSEAAKFYGIDLAYDAQARKVLLKKGSRTVKVILSQPFFMLVDPEASSPMDPVEMVSGQLAVPVESAGDLLGAVLNVNARYLPDSRTLVVGGVKDAEIRQEILAQIQAYSPTPTPAFVLAAAPTPTPAALLLPAPTPTPRLVILAPPTPGTPGAPGPTASPGAPGTGGEEEDLDVTPAPIPGKDELPPSKEMFRVRRIIIDAGHGGVDNGAKGFDKKYTEKQATLDIAKKVAAILEQQKDLDVFLTRDGDYYITLKYRTTFANGHNADLFVSIHCNANPNTAAYGTETYVYSSKASNEAAEVAAVHENGQDNLLDFTLNDLHNRIYQRRSFALAEMVDSRIRQQLGQHIRRIQQAPFYVLARVNMPSILVETAFITNQREEEKLKDEDWRDRIAHAIADGILAYKKKVEGSFGTDPGT